MTDLEIYQASLNRNAMIHCLLVSLIEASGLKARYNDGGEEGCAWERTSLGELEITIFSERPCFGKFDLSGNGQLQIRLHDLDLKLDADLNKSEWEVTSSPFDNDKWRGVNLEQKRLFWSQKVDRDGEWITVQWKRGKSLNMYDVAELIKSFFDFYRKNPESDE